MFSIADGVWSPSGPRLTTPTVFSDPLRPLMIGSARGAVEARSGVVSRCLVSNFVSIRGRWGYDWRLPRNQDREVFHTAVGG